MASAKTTIDLNVPPDEVWQLIGGFVEDADIIHAEPFLLRQSWSRRSLLANLKLLQIFSRPQRSLLSFHRQRLATTSQ
jgi:hypothetical protein